MKYALTEKKVEDVLKTIPGYGEVQEYIEKMAKQYARHLRPVEQVRKMMDKRLGRRSLSQMVLKMRE